MFDNLEEDLMTLEDLCYKLKISEGTAYRLLRSGAVKAFRVGNRRKTPSDAARKFIKEQMSSKKALLSNDAKRPIKKQTVKKLAIWRVF